MNLMRKIVGHTRGGGETMQPPQDATLGLRHLCKMFEEFRHSPSGVSQKQLEDKLYNMLPLFCKVCVIGTHHGHCHNMLPLFCKVRVIGTHGHCHNMLLLFCKVRVIGTHRGHCHNMLPLFCKVCVIGTHHGHA